MSKMTFRDFLMEVDAGDLQLAKQAAEKQAVDAENVKGRDQFKKEMTGASPSQGDVIQTQTGYFIVSKMSPQGIHVQQAGGNKTATIPHGTKFKSTGKAPSGKPVFQIVK